MTEMYVQPHNVLAHQNRSHGEPVRGMPSIKDSCLEIIRKPNMVCDASRINIRCYTGCATTGKCMNFHAETRKGLTMIIQEYVFGATTVIIINKKIGRHAGKTVRNHSKLI